jgi:L-histidine N-alpha-methyltransferase
VRDGLTARPKVLEPKYFYDALGSRLFDAICELPEYYLTRAEAEILDEIASELAASFAGPLRLLELGSGDAHKVHRLLQVLRADGAPIEYVPIDLSRTAIERSSVSLFHAFPGLDITAFIGDFWEALRQLATDQETAAVAADPIAGRRTLVLFLGSTLGNLEPAGQRRLLAKVRMLLRPGDGFLLGLDLRKPANILVPAYSDALGVTAAFNLNLLVRINRELGGDFDLSRFEHVAFYNHDLERIEMHLASRTPQQVRVGALGLDVSFGAGETIFTESSYKFDLGEISRMAVDEGFVLGRTWLDSAELFAVTLLEAS